MFSRETLELGSTPYEEQCAQVGDPDYGERARRECIAFMDQVVRQHGEPPDGASLRIKANAHDFGTYYEVAVVYDPEDEAAVRYADKVDNDMPARWDDAARKELGL